MKTEELTALGLTEDQVKAVFAMNGKDVEAAKKTNDPALQKQIETLTAERDNLDGQLKAANATLAKFGDNTPESMQAEIEKYKTQMADKEKEFKAQLTARDQSDWLDKKMEEYGVSSPYARTALKNECMSKDSGLTWKDNSFYGFDDFMKAAKTKDPALYQTEDEKKTAEQQAKLEGNKPTFVAPLDGNKPAEGAPKKEIPKVW